MFLFDLIWANGDIDAYEVLKYAQTEGLESVPVDLGHNDRAMIQFWLEANKIEDDAKCSVDYLRQLKNKIESDKENSHMLNVMEIYYATELNLLSFCGDKVAEYGGELRQFLEEKRGSIKMIAVEFNLWLHKTDNSEAALRPIAEWMLMNIGVQNGMEEGKFIEAWRHGQCEGILNKMSDNRMQPFANFLMMIDAAKFNPYKLRSTVSSLIVSLVQCCEYFRSEEAIIRAWDALQTSTMYKSLRKSPES